ncbi:elongation factor 1-beta [Candidatus Woesearchaeota archaeon]|nr:elongation factor 1-beta [Candidatus Woesearchaeota archaeon]
MAKMFITIKIMPEYPEVDLNEIRKKAKETADNFGAELLDKDIIEPVAFGLKALKLMFLLDESKGSEDLSNEISSIENVSSAEVVDMRRAVG